MKPTDVPELHVGQNCHRQETVVPTEARRGDVIRGGGDAVFVGGVGDRGGLLLGGDASPLGRRFYVLLLLV